MKDDATRDGPQVLAQFLHDWTSLWQQELQAQARDPGTMQAAALTGKPGSGSPDMSAAMELWRKAMGIWAETLGASPAATVRSLDRPIPPRTAAAAAAPDPRDAEVERLVRRVDELEARLAKLEAPRRRRS
jgi:hypothetical protein